jgi:hypothetical protein
VFNGCATREPLGSFDTTFKPDQGAQILAIDATHVLLQGHSGDLGYLRVFAFDPLDLDKNPAPVGEATMVPKIRSAALLVAGGTTFAAAGVPTAIVDGKTCGQVVLFEVGASGIESTPSASLHDAQPETNESFGRGVAAMPFHGAQVLAVAADNEIFVYFRANLSDGTPLYDETRQGR